MSAGKALALRVNSRQCRPEKNQDYALPSLRHYTKRIAQLRHLATLVRFRTSLTLNYSD